MLGWSSDAAISDSWVKRRRNSGSLARSSPHDLERDRALEGDLGAAVDDAHPATSGDGVDADAADDGTQGELGHGETVVRRPTRPTAWWRHPFRYPTDRARIAAFVRPPGG